LPRINTDFHGYLFSQFNPCSSVLSVALFLFNAESYTSSNRSSFLPPSAVRNANSASASTGEFLKRAVYSGV